MAENDVIITVSVDAKDAQAAIELFGKDAVKSIKKAEDATKDFGDSFKFAAGKIGAAVGVIAAGYAIISKGIEEAVADQKLILQLNASLQSTGEFSKDASDGILEYADALSQATSVSDDLIKQTFITAKTFGISNEEAKKLTATALDYAAATGIDVESAVQRLGQTFDGTVGKIGLLGKEFRNLTEDQLKNGTAVDLVAEKYAGAAAAQSDTFEGATKRLSKSIDDLLKAFGKLIVESPAIVEGITNIAKAINTVAGAVPKIIAPLREYQNELDLDKAKKFVDQNELIGNSSREVTSSFADIVKQAKNFSSASTSFDSFSEKIKVLEVSAKSAGEKTGKELEELQKKAQKLAEEFSKFSAGIDLQTADPIGQLAIKTKESLDKLAQFEKDGAVSSKASTDLRLKIVQDFNQKVALEQQKSINEQRAAEEKAAKEQIDLAKKTADELRASIERASAQPLKFAIEQNASGKDFSKEQGAAMAVGFTSSLLKGKAGALDVISQGLGGFADTIIPGIGGAVGGLAQLLAQGPEATKKFIREFIDSVPDIIIAIAESIPVVVEAFVDAMVNKGGAARIAIAIAKAMVFAPTWASIGKQLSGEFGKEAGKPFEDAAKQFADDSSSFGSNISGAFKQFVKDIGPSIGRGFSNLGPALSNGLKEGLSSFVASIAPFFNGLFDAIRSAFSGFFEGMANLFAQFPQQLLDAITNIASALVAPFSNAIAPLTSAILPLTESINGLLGPINDLIAALKGGKGGGAGVLSESFGKVTDAINKIPGVKQATEVFGRATGLFRAKGGIVPMYAADGAFVPRGTDTVPAMLTPGELVVPRDLVGELGQFLAANANSGGPTAQDAMLAQILSVVSAPVVVQSEVKVNQNAFADIILQLNRQNARLTA